jgi:hypothetical protein
MMNPDGRDPLCVDVPLVRPFERDETEATPLVNLSMQHRRTLEEAQSSLATAVHKVYSQCCSGRSFSRHFRTTCAEAAELRR